MGLFITDESVQIGILRRGQEFSAMIDVRTYLGLFSHVHVILWGTQPVFYSDCFEYNTLAKGDQAIYQASANARDYIRKAIP